MDLFTTVEPKLHTITNIEIIKRFLNVDTVSTQVDKKTWKSEIKEICDENVV